MRDRRRRTGRRLALRGKREHADMVRHLRADARRLARSCRTACPLRRWGERRSLKGRGPASGWNPDASSATQPNSAHDSKPRAGARFQPDARTSSRGGLGNARRSSPSRTGPSVSAMCWLRRAARNTRPRAVGRWHGLALRALHGLVPPAPDTSRNFVPALGRRRRGPGDGRTPTMASSPSTTLIRPQSSVRRRSSRASVRWPRARRSGAT